jgi:hypothetical protein
MNQIADSPFPGLRKCVKQRSRDSPTHE